MIYTDLKYQGKTPLGYHYIFNFRKCRIGGKIKLFWGLVSVGVGGPKGRRNEVVYGEYVLYPCMKTEE
jgi:hypothetical protein